MVCVYIFRNVFLLISLLPGERYDAIVRLLQSAGVEQTLVKQQEDDSTAKSQDVASKPKHDAAEKSSRVFEELENLKRMYIDDDDFQNDIKVIAATTTSAAIVVVVVVFCYHCNRQQFFLLSHSSRCDFSLSLSSQKPLLLVCDFQDEFVRDALALLKSSPDEARLMLKSKHAVMQRVMETLKPYIVFCKRNGIRGDFDVSVGRVDGWIDFFQRGGNQWRVAYYRNVQSLRRSTSPSFDFSLSLRLRR